MVSFVPATVSPTMHKTNNVKTYLLSLILLYPFTVYGQTKKIPVDTIRSIRLHEVVVTATQPNTPETRSVIGQDAIRHIQATDLSDLSQLLPGVPARNPNLNSPAVFTIRSATYNNTTNASGTAILVDAIRMSNNVNMQQMGFTHGNGLFNSTVLSGFDVRSLSTSSIESVEVIRGIPSVRYGDVTSGVLLVNSRAGVAPFTASLRFTATEKLAAFGKGLKLDSTGCALYLGADYALSEQDSRLPEQSFQRFGFQASLAKDFISASLRLNLRLYRLQDNDGRGQNTVEGEYQKVLNQGVSLSANGKWNLKRPWITYLEYRAGFSYGQQRNQSSTYYSGTQQVTTYTTQAGEQEGIFLQPNYFTQLSVEGRPLSAEGSVTGNLQSTIYNKVKSHLLIGIEAHTEGNRGKGISFDPLHPPFEMRKIRTRSYHDIPFVHHCAAFAEERFSFRTGGMKTEVQAGIRMNGIQTKALKSSLSFDPRINVRQSFIEEENTLLKHLSIRAGWGLMHKMPPLAYLYPDKAYTDESCFTYNDAENGQRLTVLHTFITNRTFNAELRQPVNRKFEIGLNLQVGNITAYIVWFNEHLRNGYCTSQEATPFSYRRYTPLTTSGEHPVLTENGIMNNGQPLPFTDQTTFALYMRPQNGIEQKKQGIEFTLDLGKWKRLCSSLFISGGFLEVKEKNNALTAFHPQIERDGMPYPYTGVYEATDFIGNLRIWQQLNTRFQFITQLPRIGLVTSLTLQAVWIDKQQRKMESNYNNPVYLADENGNRIEGDPMTDTEHRKCLNPVYYLDSEGNKYLFTPDMETDKRFADLVMNAGLPTISQKDSFKPYFLLNLRVSKQIGSYVSVSFCANNLTQSNPQRYLRSTRQYSVVNPDLYYGAEVTVLF